MNELFSDIIILFDKSVCSPEILVNNYLQCYNVDDLVIKNKIQVTKTSADEMQIYFPTQGHSIYFLSTVSGQINGHRALISLVPEHLKDSNEVKFSTRILMNSDFVGYYNQTDMV